ncbi:MAG: CoA pyrophosphatase [Acidiferrobacterales bacterium]|nr:CoA pyrophosphatase [Acidiferrobacterales bacterium]
MKSIEFKLREIKAVLLQHSPQPLSLETAKEAAVALVLRQGIDDVEMLFIQRATSERDPWSGQIAFPGGGKEPSDADLVETAMRETEEEVAVMLNDQLFCHHLMDQQGSNRGGSMDLMIRCLVFETNRAVRPVPNYEVAEVFWVPLSRLVNPEHQLTFQPAITNKPANGIDLGEGCAGQPRILWGLTYRFVQYFFTLLNKNV